MVGWALCCALIRFIGFVCGCLLCAFSVLVVAIGLLCWLLLRMFVLCGLVVGLELFDSVFVYLCSGAIWF